VPGLEMTLKFRLGDSINVGFSAKFDADQFVADLADLGLTQQAFWTDAQLAYGIFLFRRAASSPENSVSPARRR
jgi:L-histidine Nalpha-methyltransferase